MSRMITRSQSLAVGIGGVGEQLDPIAVRVADLHAHKAVIALPLGFRHTGLAEALASGSHIVRVGKLEPEMVARRQPDRRLALFQCQQRPVASAKNQQVLVVVHPIGEPEVPAVERRGPCPIADRERYVI